MSTSRCFSSRMIWAWWPNSATTMCVIYAGQTVEAGRGRRRAAGSLTHPLHARRCWPAIPERATSDSSAFPAPCPPHCECHSGCRFAPRCRYSEPCLTSDVPAALPPSVPSASGVDDPLHPRCMTAPILELRDLSVMLGGSGVAGSAPHVPNRCAAVSGVSLAIHPGEVALRSSASPAPARPPSAAPSWACSAKPPAKSCWTASNVGRLITRTQARQDPRRDIQYVHQDAAAALDPMVEHRCAPCSEGLLDPRRTLRGSQRARGR